MIDESGAQQMKTPNIVRAYQREWLKNTRDRVDQGEPFVIMNGDDVEEILNIMDIPFMVIGYWVMLIGYKQMGEYYNKVLIERGYPAAQFAWGLASTLDNKPEVAPWRGLPNKVAVIIGSSRADFQMRVTELWARETGATVFPLDFCLTGGMDKPLPPRAWELIKDHWDDFIEPHVLDQRIKEENELIQFLEVRTGKKFSLAKLSKAVDLANEQMAYWKKAHDLIAATIPCPVSLRDQLAMYQVMWHRGTVMGRDLFKMFYEEVKERAEKGIAAFPGEKLRLYWGGGTPPTWAKYIEDRCGAVAVCSSFSCLPAYNYPRTVINNDPMRAMVSRHVMLFTSSPEFLLEEAKQFQCDAIILPGETPYSKYFEDNGMPYLGLPGGYGVAQYRGDAEVKSIVAKWIETRLLQKS